MDRLVMPVAIWAGMAVGVAMTFALPQPGYDSGEDRGHGTADIDGHKYVHNLLNGTGDGDLEGRGLGNRSDLSNGHTRYGQGHYHDYGHGHTNMSYHEAEDGSGESYEHDYGHGNGHDQGHGHGRNYSHHNHRHCPGGGPLRHSHVYGYKYCPTNNDSRHGYHAGHRLGEHDLGYVGDVYKRLGGIYVLKGSGHDHDHGAKIIAKLV